MPIARDIAFGPFRFDFADECLWRDTQAISLRPKAFAVLKLLVEHAGRLVTTQQVLDTVWPGTFVGDAVLKDNIRQLRDALGDDARSPRYIETAHRRGYRFIAKLSELPPNNPHEPEHISKLSPKFLPLRESGTTIRVLGRDAELGNMRGWFNRAMTGERQTVFVTGEPGIGKSSVVEAFLKEAACTLGLRVVRGGCLEQYGAGEAYLPILEGFSRLCRSPEGAEVLDSLRQHAPAWLSQMPSSVAQAERDGLHSRAEGATRERMLREMADAIDALTSQLPLLLVLEDLHWSDYSTLDLVSYLARRRDRARLMIIGTYRPVDVILGEHPLKGVKRELQAHGLCHELALEYLGEDVIAEYLAAKFPSHQFPPRFRRMIHRRTEGNPLFMANIVDFFTDQKDIVEEQGTWKLRVDLADVEQRVPSNLRELIEKQIDRLNPDERIVLEGASVAGMECSSVAIAAGLDVPTEWVERHCEELARRHQFLSPAWLAQLPDGTVTPRHRFNHILYLEVAYRLIPAARRAQIHQRIAQCGMVIYGDRTNEIAAELAMHFEQSRDWERALQYLIHAAENAVRKSAHHEAAALAKRGLLIRKPLAPSVERDQQEITLRMILSVSLMAIKGFASSEFEEVYNQGKQLFWSKGPSPHLFNMLYLLGLFYITGGQITSALEIANQLLELAQGLNDPTLIMEAHRAMGATLIELGRYYEAFEHSDRASQIYSANQNRPYTLTIGHDCKVLTECSVARALWALGFPDAAVERMRAGLAFAKELSHPQSLIGASHLAAQLHQLRGEPLLAKEHANAVVQLADEYGLEFWAAIGKIDLGWADAELGDVERGIKQMQQAIAAFEATGSKLWLPYFLGLLADQFAKTGCIEEGLATVAKALTIAEHSGERYSLAELHRIKGELLIKSAGQSWVRSLAPNTNAESTEISPSLAQAQSCFAEAHAIAKQQQAVSWASKIVSSTERLKQNMAWGNWVTH